MSLGTKRRSMSPPRWWAAFVVTLLLLATPISVVADNVYFNDHTTLKKSPTAAQPWMVVQLCYFDRGGNDSYFTADPEIWIDDTKIVTLTKLRVENETAADKERQEDGWYKDYWSVLAGNCRWQVRMYDPRKDGNKHYVDVYIVPSYVTSGTHKLEIKGEWQANRESSKKGVKSWKPNTNGNVSFPDGGWALSSMSRTNYNTLSTTLKLNSSLSSINVGVTGTASQTSTYTAMSSLAANATFSKTASATQTFTYTNVSASAQTVYFEYAYTASFVHLDGGSVSDSFISSPTLYKWFSAKINPYPTPGTVSATTDLWNKKITVEWNKAGSNTDTGGTWAVQRQTKGNSTWTTVAQNLSAATAKCIDESSDLKYSTDYIYRVVFVPTGTSLNNVHSNLLASAATALTPKFDIKISEVKGGTNSITLKWTSDKYVNSTNKNFTIYRSVDNGSGSYSWKSIATVAATSGSQSYSYTDSNGLTSCINYVYKVETTPFDGYTVSTGDKGLIAANISSQSKVISVTASKGDYTGIVKVTWKVNMVTTDDVRFEVSRRLIGNEKWSTIHTTKGTDSDYAFDDNTALPGNYYEYRVRSIVKCNDSDVYTDITDQGFCRSTGIVSGRVTYGTGTAVPNVKVLVAKTNDDDDDSQFYSMNMEGSKSGITLGMTKEEQTEAFGDKFTVMLKVRPDASQNAAKSYLMDIGTNYSVTAKKTLEQGKMVLNFGGRSASTNNALKDSCYLVPGEFNSVAFTRDGNNLAVHVIGTDGRCRSTTLTYSGTAATWDCQTLAFGCYSKTVNTSSFKGAIDDVRIYSGVAMTKDEILSSYDHPLTGSEKNLYLYWPMDEGIMNQTTAFDYSRSNGVPNGHHGAIAGGTPSNKLVPPASMFSLYALTDTLGNYTVRGIPFSGDGNTYTITPELGIHSFNPIRQNAFISASSLVHNNVNFTDESSFKVTGRVYYNGTSIPVEGCNLYVDGTVCSKDGDPITTKDDGTFEISVSIGDHSIQIKKDGHTFTDNGRWPEKAGLTHTFDREMSGITFWDSTLVNFTGRIAGGSDQYSLPLGFGKSTNNVGEAKLTLRPQKQTGMLNVAPQDENATTTSFDPAKTERTLSSQTQLIESDAWIGKGDSCNAVYITTDPKTGEFSALLPPLEYEVQSVTFGENNDNNTALKTALSNFANVAVNLTNPKLEYTDSIENADGTYSYYKYVAALNRELRVAPTFIVEQTSPKPVVEGAFGIDQYTISDDAGADLTVNIYEQQSGGSIVYNYGAPIYESLSHYTFKLTAYEMYVNYDNELENGRYYTDKVPLNGLGVNISNAMASSQSVYNEGDNSGSLKELVTDEITLDSLGTYTYSWTAGLPNIVSPYKRAIQITSEVNNATTNWFGTDMEGIVLGSLPTGTNFVTQGPDFVEMILRDPPGSLSSATWTTGTSTITYKSKGAVWTSDNEVMVEKKLGYKLKTSSGLGFAKITEAETEADISTGITASTTGEDATSWTKSVTCERSISTSDSPDFVGPLGDLFIGSSSNLNYGKARQVDLRRKADDAKAAELSVADVITTGLSYDTKFQFTAYYIENTLIPNLEALRNALLVHVDSISNYKNDTGRPVYITTLQPDDEGYGTNNNDPLWVGNKVVAPTSEGKSYTLVNSKSCDSLFVDSIVFYNMSISNWKKALRLNEMEKVMANRDRGQYLSQNLSLDGGTSVTMTETTTESKTSLYDITVIGVVHAGAKTGVELDGFGFETSISTDTGGGTHETTEDTEETTSSFSYTLAEDGTDDAISVDVYKYGSYGPIFRTTAGQTSAPYEGEVRTSYYEEDAVLMVGTMQIEQPQIMVDNKKWSTVSGVPSGSAANYTLQLQNISETNTDLYFKLLVSDDSNPNGAIVSIDGMPLTSSRLVKVPATETLSKQLQITQSNQSVLKYDSIAIVLGSEMQWDPTSVYGQIADTVYVSAEFVPSSSPVEMELNKTVINAFTKDDLDITFRNFDRNYHGLQAFRVQSYAPGANGWSTLREYKVNPGDNFKPDAVSVALPKDNDITYTYDMSSCIDGTYRFRVISVSNYGQQEITRSSGETTIVKDMAKPRPLGLPEPSDGILGIGKDISVTFNEDIVKGKLKEEDNFEVTGVLNGATVDHGTALSMQDTDEAAATEADIDLGGKDFAFDFWYNAKSAGTLLSHGGGAERFSLAITDDNRLRVDIGKKSYTSDEALPMNKWAYLSVSYKTADNGGVLNASVGYDAYVVKLFTDIAVTSYSASGRLSVGKNISGAMQELTLWDEAHSMSKAQAERQTTKQASTPHLIGYWPMNEGEGTVATDVARNRHLALPASTWFIDGDNYAVQLDGTAPLLIQTGHIAPANTDNYAVELWMKADEQEGEARLLQMGDAALTCNTSGQIVLTNDEEAIGTSTATVLDNAWHHVALNVLRSGNVTVYVDGERAITTAATNIGNLASNALVIGARRSGDTTPTAFTYDQMLRGVIDEVRVWSATLDASTIESNRKLRLTGEESGLAAYYPFERQRLSRSGVLETVPVDTCMSTLGHGLAATYNDATPVFVDDAPSLRTKPVEENVSFYFTASDNKIVIEITEEACRIEGCTLNFKVKDVYDANGNVCAPVCWQSVVSRNPLSWRTESNTSAEYAVAQLETTQKLGATTQLTAYIVNRSSTAQAWHIDGLPSWMQLSADNGTLEAQSEQRVTITITSACPTGRHSIDLYVTNADGMSTAMNVNVKVEGDTPQWSVDAAKYETSMNIIGMLAIDGTLSTDADDLVGAFINGECRGVAHPAYNARYDNYYILMDVYANGSEKGQEVEFRVYDASSDCTLPRVATNKEIVFESNELYGSYQVPVMFTSLPFVEQTLSLVEGWNWISLAVTPDDCHVQSIFIDTADDLDVVKSKRASAVRFENSWEGNNFLMDNSEMFKVKAVNAASQKLLGAQPDTNQRTITVRQGWNWVAYNAMQPMDIADAFAGASPQDGDLVKGKQGFALFDGYEWNGSLTTLMPGQGYMYRTTATGTRTFCYPESSLRRYVQVRNGLRSDADDSRQPAIFTPVDDALYAGNMTVVAQVTYDGAPLANVEVGVFAGDECRTHEYSDANGIAYLTIPGDRAEQLSFRVNYANEEYVTEAALVYEDDGTVGNSREPFVIAFTHDTPTVIMGIDADNDSYGWTDLSGRRLPKAPHADGVYIRTKDGKSEKVVVRRHK